eukprot:1741781-Pyramimonas_sp.AAC.1
MVLVRRRLRRRSGGAGCCGSLRSVITRWQLARASCGSGGAPSRARSRTSAPVAALRLVLSLPRVVQGGVLCLPSAGLTACQSTTACGFFGSADGPPPGSRASCDFVRPVMGERSRRFSGPAKFSIGSCSCRWVRTKARAQAAGYI